MNSKESDAPWWVYVLRNTHTAAVYTGCTNRPDHRLRAHQCHISGGARTTRRWVTRHGADSVTMWMLLGPLDKIAAQSLERKLKQTRVGPPGVAGRLQAINKLLGQAHDNQGQITAKCCLDTTFQVQLSCAKQDVTKFSGKKPLMSNAVWRFGCQLPPPAD